MATAVKKVLVFGASLNKNSFNQQFAEFAAKQLSGVELKIVRLENFYPLPIFTPQELEAGIPENAKLFVSEVQSVDAVVISLAENNWSYAAAFKNLLDWASRAAPSYDQTWAKKKFLLLSASPSPYGGAKVIEAAKYAFPILGADIISSFSLKKNYESFKDGNIVDAEQKKDFEAALAQFQQALQ